jgi:gas vesicle structural protein
MNASHTRCDKNEERISLCETLDRVLNKGVVVTGELVISVADIDLIYLGLNVLLSSVETAKRKWPAPVSAGLAGGQP